MTNGYINLKNYTNILEVRNENKKIILKSENIDNNYIDNKIKSLNKNIEIDKKKIDLSFLNETKIIVKKNDTFSKIIDPFFENNEKKYLIIKEVNKKFNLKNLNINQEIFFYSNDKKEVVKLVLPVTFETDIILEIFQDRIKSYEEKNEIVKEINALEFKITSSLYKDGLNAGIPISILTNAIRLYSFDIDFQRDIQKDTLFQVSYEKLININKNKTSYGKIKYINLKIDNKDLEYFLFETNDKKIDYFNGSGKNVKKSLLKTPIDGARLSSNFGMRKHPISGFNKLHKGVDFAAAKGTPVYAGGDGVVEYSGNNGGYGKYIRLRHNNEYKTAYAHLSGFSKNISKGKRVNQGDIIGYVGSTGKSTGSHLHYEIIYQNKQINPMKMNLPSGKILTGKELERFKIKSKNIYAKFLFVLYE